MTGFGKAVVVFKDKKITAEIKSLNSKQLDLAIRLPQAYREIELELRNMVAKTLERGKADLYIYTEANESSTTATINIEAMAAYKRQLQQLSETLGIPEPQDWLATLLRMPDTIKSDAGSGDVEEGEIEAIKQATTQAVDALIEFRTQEGRRLEQFFKQKIENIRALLNDVAPLEAERIAKIKARILDSLSKLDGVEYDHNRFEQ